MSIEPRFEKVLRRAFRQPNLHYRPDLSPWDVPGWDSLGQMQLVLESEAEFGIRFRPEEVAKLLDGAELLALIGRKLTDPGR